MRTRRAGGDAHAGGDEAGVLALGDADEDLDLAGREDLQEPGALVVGLGDGVEEFGEGGLEEGGGDGDLAARALLMARSTPSMRSSWRT